MVGIKEGPSHVRIGKCEKRGAYRHCNYSFASLTFGLKRRLNTYKKNHADWKDRNCLRYLNLSTGILAYSRGR